MMKSFSDKVNEAYTNGEKKYLEPINAIEKKAMLAEKENLQKEEEKER